MFFLPWQNPGYWRFQGCHSHLTVLYDFLYQVWPTHTVTATNSLGGWRGGRWIRHCFSWLKNYGIAYHMYWLGGGINSRTGKGGKMCLLFKILSQKKKKKKKKSNTMSWLYTVIDYVLCSYCPLLKNKQTRKLHFEDSQRFISECLLACLAYEHMYVCDRNARTNTRTRYKYKQIRFENKKSGETTCGSLLHDGGKKVWGNLRWRQ